MGATHLLVRPRVKENVSSVALVASVCLFLTFSFMIIKSSHNSFIHHFIYYCRLRENYGGIFSLKLGSYKVVMAATSEAVKEMLVTKSGDFAGRPQTFAFYNITLGVFSLMLIHRRRQNWLRY